LSATLPGTRKPFTLVHLRVFLLNLDRTVVELRRPAVARRLAKCRRDGLGGHGQLSLAVRRGLMGQRPGHTLACALLARPDVNGQCVIVHNCHHPHEAGPSVDARKLADDELRGQVTPGGVVGARRPTVTLALRKLSDEGSMVH
jgi:hypothetical protein